MQDQSFVTASYGQCNACGIQQQLKFVFTKILATVKTDWLVALSCILHCYYILQERRNKDLLANISTAVKISQCWSNHRWCTHQGLLPLILVLQTPQLQKWLVKYGNTITCMDAMYEKHKNEFHANLSFVVVKMSLGIGWVPATIILQYVTTEMIKEGLQILKSWNPQWKPTFFTTDKNSHELEAVGAVHPTCIRYICDLISTEARHLRSGWTEQQNWSYTNHKKSGACVYEMSFICNQWWGWQ